MLNTFLIIVLLWIISTMVTTYYTSKIFKKSRIFIPDFFLFIVVLFSLPLTLIILGYIKINKIKNI